MNEATKGSSAQENGRAVVNRPASGIRAAVRDAGPVLRAEPPRYYLPPSSPTSPPSERSFSSRSPAAPPRAPLPQSSAPASTRLPSLATAAASAEETSVTRPYRPALAPLPAKRSSAPPPSSPRVSLPTPGARSSTRVALRALPEAVLSGRQDVPAVEIIDVDPPALSVATAARSADETPVGNAYRPSSRPPPPRRSSTPPPLPPAAASKVTPAPEPAAPAEGLDELRALAVAANAALGVLQHTIREFERRLARLQEVRDAAHSKANDEPIASPIAPTEPVASATATSEPPAPRVLPAAPPTTSLQPSTLDSIWENAKRRQRMAVAVMLPVIVGVAGLLAALIHSCAG